MATHEVDASRIGGVLRKMSAEQISGITNKATTRAALKGLRIVAKATPSDRGLARAAWDVDIKPGRGADLTNDSPYSGILEMGSRPHTPPLMPILRWVVRRWGLDLSGGRRSFESIKDVPYPTYLAAKTIQERIGREGTKPYGMVTNNLSRLTRILRDEVTREIKRTKPR